MECVYLIILLIGFGHTAAYTRTKEMCRYMYFFILYDTCITNIICEPGTRIKITNVEYRDSSLQRTCDNCGGCCYIGLRSSTEHKYSINEFCNDQYVCSLVSWKPHTGWKMRITYVCEYSTPAPTTTTTTVVSTTTMPITPLQKTTPKMTTVSTTTTPTTPVHRTTTKMLVSSRLTTTEQASSKISTNSIRTVTMYHENTKSGSFPLAASIAIPTGVVVVIMIIAGIVCGIRRRFINNTLRSNEVNHTLRSHGGNSVRMQEAIYQSVETGSDSVGHYEDIDMHTEQEQVYENGQPKNIYESFSVNT